MDDKDSRSASHVADVDDGLTKGPIVKETNVHSVALEEALQAQKPSLWSKNMLHLYFIMGLSAILWSPEDRY
jgi:hypothetical protein